MSHVDLVVDIDKPDISVTVEKTKSVNVSTQEAPGIVVIASGNIGPRGPAGQWEALTQSEYDQLSPPNPDTLYVIIQ